MATVQDILHEKGSVVHTIVSGAVVYDAIQKMVQKNVGALLVVDDGALKGIITERDYLKRVALHGKSSRNTLVSEIMTTDLVSVSLKTEVSECMALMIGRRFRHLPVIEAGGLIGVVSIGDLVKSKLREQDAHIQNLTYYIQGAVTGSCSG
jgi:CBS domain-containing protein